ncbi:MAG: transglutaminase family protein, partial [Planctomycetes bacterium]|nr:transglutaminase family protein [Planctomycetota bacterium]
INTEPEADSDDPGKVYHYYSRPYAYEQLHNQGVWTETEKTVDVSVAPGATIKSLTSDPAGDASVRQHMSCVEYPGAPGKACSSKYEIDLWTNACRKFVYPHRANRNTDALKGTDYLDDDPDLFNLTDAKTYDAFFERVKTHVKKKYGAEADLTNPYWAARNALEYIQDNYYYPNRAKRKPAAVDYDRKHYDANPGNLKIELSKRDYDKSQIIACSGTSVMLAGAMRYLGIPARWLGTGTQQKSDLWDTNDNGLLDENETAPCSNGHRYTQVWLGSHYGWICFDGTPSKPDLNDYDPPPPLQPQWRFMNRAAAGHRTEKRIVFNVGSTLIRPLYRAFEYDEELAVDNNCGGDQRYNLQGRFDKPELWKLASHDIAVKNTCFIEDVTLSGPSDQTRVTWRLKGDWDKDPRATVSAYLVHVDSDTGEPEDIATIANAIPYDSGAARVDLSEHRGKLCGITLRKDGDPETGGHSETFRID